MGKLGKEQRFKKNPFRDAVIQHTRQGMQTIFSSPTREQTFAAVNRETGEDMGDISLSFGQKITVDKTGFLKMYANGVKMFLGLKSAGIKVFMIIFDMLLEKENYGKDQIGLKYDLLNDETKKNISEATFFRGIRELKKANFLAPTYFDGIYWINTDYVFRGNRLTLVNQYIVDDANKIFEFDKTQNEMKPVALDKAKSSEKA